MRSFLLRDYIFYSVPQAELDVAIPHEVFPIARQRFRAVEPPRPSSQSLMRSFLLRETLFFVLFILVAFCRNPS